MTAPITGSIAKTNITIAQNGCLPKNSNRFSLTIEIYCLRDMESRRIFSARFLGSKNRYLTSKANVVISTPVVTIREVREDELLKTGELWADFMEYNAKFDDSFRVRAKATEIFSKEMLDKFPARDYRLAVAEKSGDLIGFCFSYISQKPEYFKIEKFGFIGDLYVKPEFRRLGVGHDLVKDAFNFFAKRNISQIELLVAVKNLY